MQSTLSRRRALAVFAALAAPASGARAQGSTSPFPPRPVRIVVPYGPGGIADLTARAVAHAVGPRLNQTVYVENKPGAGGITAAETVAHATPDGTTLLLVSNGTAVTSGLFKHLPFDAQKDFAPISLIGTFDLAIVVPANSRFRTLADLLAAARAQPGKLNIATVAVGSTQNLAAELFKTTAGISAQVVPFNGTPPVITALRGGEVDAAVEILGPIKPQVQAGAIRLLAVMGARRPRAFPQVPTVAETGGPLAGFDVASWNGLAAPARTPKDVVLRLQREVQAALAEPEVRDRLAGFDVDARSSTPEQLWALLASDTKRWGEVIAHAGIPRQ